MKLLKVGDWLISPLISFCTTLELKWSPNNVRRCKKKVLATKFAISILDPILVPSYYIVSIWFDMIRDSIPCISMV